MTIVVAGASGLIGTALVMSLRGDGHEVLQLVRREPTSKDQVTWSPHLGARGATADLRAALEGAEAVVNLAGAGVAGKRWDDTYKRQILESRVSATTCLATAIAETTTPMSALTGRQPQRPHVRGGCVSRTRAPAPWPILRAVPSGVYCP